MGFSIFTDTLVTLKYQDGVDMEGRAKIRLKTEPKITLCSNSTAEESRRETLSSITQPIACTIGAATNRMKFHPLRLILPQVGG